VKRYNHPAKRDAERPTLCFICGDPVTGADGYDGGDLRHVGEEVRVALVPPEYLPILGGCVAVVERALSEIPTERATDYERARIAVNALIHEGFLRTRRIEPPKYPARN
jgi:hypothetical protein